MNDIAITVSRIERTQAQLRQDSPTLPDGRSSRRGRRSVFEEILMSLAAQDRRKLRDDEHDDSEDGNLDEQMRDAVMYNQLVKRGRAKN